MGLKFNDMFPSRFFKADDLAQPLMVKIKEVKIERLGGDNGDEKPVLYFINQEKGLALNKTNAVSIINATGSDDVDDWVGARIELYRDTVLFHGQRTPCVRVRKPSEKKAKAPVAPPEAIADSWEEEIPDPGDPQ
jgi:hypothetical protein